MTFIYPPVSLQIAASPASFLEDGTNTTVLEDTETPANSKPLPVKQLNPDGTELDPATEAKQDDTITQLTSINAKDFATQTTLEAARVLLASLDGKDFATQTTLEAARVLLASLDGKDYATQTTLASLESKDFSTSAKQDTLLAEIQKLTSQEANKRVIDSYFNASLSIPSGSRTAALMEVPASTKAVELEIILKGGVTVSIYDAATSGNLLGRVTNGGGKIPISLAAASEIFLQSDGSTFSATDLTMNLIGVDA